MDIVNKNAVELPLEQKIELLKLKKIKFYLYEEVKFKDSKTNSLFVKRLSLNEVNSRKKTKLLLKDIGNTLVKFPDLNKKGLYYFEDLKIKKYDKDYINLVEKLILDNKLPKFNIFNSDEYENIETVKSCDGMIFQKDDPNLKKIIKSPCITRKCRGTEKHLSVLGTKKIITEAVNLYMDTEDGEMDSLGTVYVEADDSNRILNMIEQLEFNYISIKDVINYNAPLKERVVNLDDQSSAFPYQDDIPVEIFESAVKSGPKHDIFYISCVYKGKTYNIVESSCNGMSKSRILFNASKKFWEI